LEKETNKVAAEVRYCRICEDEIPRARLEALPDTRVCIKCSEKIGGEFELEVTISRTGKAGSLKKTGVDVTARRKRKVLH
jgi:hypothetical protein